MAGRPKIFDEKEVLEKAMELFWKNGYQATSTDQLLKILGINKGSLYHSFTNKKNLYLQGFALMEQEWQQEFAQHLAASDQPIQAIKSLFFQIIEEEELYGCLMGNTLVELGAQDPDFAQAAKKHLKNLENIFLEQIRKSQQTGELKTKKSPELLALALINLWNGLHITQQAINDKQALKTMVALSLEVLY